MVSFAVTVYVYCPYLQCFDIESDWLCN